MSLVRLLEKQPGREAEVGAARPVGAVAGAPYPLYWLAEWLGRRSGREAEAEAAFGRAAAAGHPLALTRLVESLGNRRGDKPILRRTSARGLRSDAGPQRSCGAVGGLAAQELLDPRRIRR